MDTSFVRQAGSIATQAAVGAAVAGSGGVGVLVVHVQYNATEQRALEALATQQMPAALAVEYYSSGGYQQLRGERGRDTLGRAGVPDGDWRVYAVTAGRGGDVIEIGYKAVNASTAQELIQALKNQLMVRDVWLDGDEVVAAYARP